MHAKCNAPSIPEKNKNGATELDDEEREPRDVRATHWQPAKKVRRRASEPAAQRQECNARLRTIQAPHRETQ